MAIVYHEKERIFKLDTPNTSYIIGIVDKENFVGHVYYGKKLKDHNVGYLMGTEEAPFVPSKNNRDRVSFRWSIRAADLGITVEAVLRYGQRADTTQYPCLMYHTGSMPENRSFPDFRRPSRRKGNVIP